MNVFPTTVKPSYPIEVTSEWKTLKTESETGAKEQRRQVWTFPRRSIKLKFDALTQDKADSIYNFFNLCKGSYEPFWFFWPVKESDGTWQSYSGEYIARGDGVTTLFELPSKETENGLNLLKNGDFETGESSDWLLFNDTGASSSKTWDTSIYEGAYSLKVSITNGLANANAVQLYQQSYSLISGVEYKLSFRAKSDAARVIQVSVIKGGSPYNSYGLQQNNISVDTTYQLYEYTFTANTTASDASLRFLLGNSNISVTVDKVSLRRNDMQPTEVYVNGVETYVTLVAGTGDAGVDKIQFLTAPANGAIITADFAGQLRYRTRFTDDKLSKEMFIWLLFNIGLEIQEVRA